MDVESFISRWEKSGAAERANCQPFLVELCQLLGIEKPDPSTPDNELNAYVFERAVTFNHGDGTSSTGFIDLYKRGCFVLEAKQGAEKEAATETLSEAAKARARKRKSGTARRGTQGWNNAMLRARGQAEQYARALPASEGRPPFLVVVDVGHSIELYSEFSRSGATYVPYPDPRSHRIYLDDLRNEAVRERLVAVWTDPMSLDPARQSARVTREIAGNLAQLAISLEKAGNPPEAVAHFLMRCLFTMFAEDVELLPKNSFSELLESVRKNREHFVPLLEEVWERMNAGGFSTTLRAKLLRFNGGLFADAGALPVTEDQLELLIEAAKADWRHVEPAIFGTLLERALNPVERHKLGAHYTPRAYVERLVLPTVIEPLRKNWEATQAAALSLTDDGRHDEAVKQIQAFHHRLCQVRILDPACGSGNFLYVALEHLKRLEGEVLDTLETMGEKQGLLDMAGVTVDPHQLLGLEVNPRAAAITDLVLWIGYLQWHFRTRGKAMLDEPVIKDFHNIRCADALIDYDDIEPLLDDDGQPITRWDGRTFKPHSVTGELVPDEAARVPVVRYLNVRQATWPEADFIIGNPPFIGASRMRHALGDGYVDAVRTAWGHVPESADFVMYWWQRAAELVASGSVKRFGFITTNSIRQTLNRRVIEPHLSGKKPLSITFAIPDHPWVDSADGAAVRIAMTACEAGERAGVLNTVTHESAGASDEASNVVLSRKIGKIYANLTIGANVAGATALKANKGISLPGVKLHGSGFIVTREQAESLGLGTVPGLEAHIREYRNGRDLTQRPRGVMVIDLFGLSAEEVRERFPAVYQWVLERVKPERDQNNRASYRDNWWVFGEPRRELRPMLEGLQQHIATVETSRHRFFTMLDGAILPDNKLLAIALDDPYSLGVLSSRVHVTWAIASGSWLGVGNDSVYVKTRCFETFPFPDASEAVRDRIAELAERLDGHRKRQQAEHPSLTMTGMYNVLEKLRAGETLTERERTIHNDGLISVLRELHDELDAAVADAYGWPADIGGEELLFRLVELNKERSAEERRGLIRWLRPDFQNPSGAVQTGAEAEGEQSAAVEAAEGQLPWPKDLAAQAQVVRAVLQEADGPLEAELVARRFKRARRDRVENLLETLTALGHMRRLDDGRFAAAA